MGLDNIVNGLRHLLNVNIQIDKAETWRINYCSRYQVKHRKEARQDAISGKGLYDFYERRDCVWERYASINANNIKQYLEKG